MTYYKYKGKLAILNDAYLTQSPAGPPIVPLPSSVYGRLYNWYAASDVNFAPTGLHVPTDAEWTTMTTYLGGTIVAGGKLKEVGLVHWNSPNGGAILDAYNFTALPGGIRNFSSGSFFSVGSNGGWWSSTANGSSTAYSRGLNYLGGFVSRDSGSKSNGFSVRCMRDLTSGEQIDFVDGAVVGTISDYEGRSYDIVRIGTQGWMTTNFACSTLNEGTPIQKVTDNAAWTAATGAAQCAYGNLDSNIPV